MVWRVRVIFFKKTLLKSTAPNSSASEGRGSEDPMLLLSLHVLDFSQSGSRVEDDKSLACKDTVCKALQTR